MPITRLQVLLIVAEQHFENGKSVTALEKCLSLFFEACSGSLFADYCLYSFLGLLTCFKGFKSGMKNLLSNYSFLLISENLLKFGLGLIIINFVIIIEHLMHIIFFSHFGLYEIHFVFMKPKFYLYLMLFIWCSFEFLSVLFIFDFITNATVFLHF